MSALDSTPSNRNFLSPLNFKFILKRAPHVNFFLQKVNLPQVTINRTPEYSNPLINIPLAGEFVTFSPLNITFKVDETTIANLSVYDVVGRKLITILDGQLPNGEYTYSENLGTLKPGVYMVTLTMENGGTKVSKIVKQ